MNRAKKLSLLRTPIPYGKPRKRGELQCAPNFYSDTNPWSLRCPYNSIHCSSVLNLDGRPVKLIKIKAMFQEFLRSIQFQNGPLKCPSYTVSYDSVQCYIFYSRNSRLYVSHFSLRGSKLIAKLPVMILSACVNSLEVRRVHLLQTTVYIHITE